MTAKLIGVAGFVGGVAAIAIICFIAAAQADAAAWPALRLSVRWIAELCIVGGGLLAFLAGFLLWIQMPGTFFRMRWFKLKAAIIVIFIPGGHLAGRFQALHLSRMIEEGNAETVVDAWMRLGWIMAIVFAAMCVLLGVSRNKPRLGQTHVPPKG